MSLAIGSHSVTCYPTQVSTPRLNPSHAGRYSIYLPRRDGRLSCMYVCLFLRRRRALSWQPHQIWGIDGQLVRELLFEDVIYGVCFANERADLLVGFGDSIQLVQRSVLLFTVY